MKSLFIPIAVMVIGTVGYVAFEVAQAIAEAAVRRLVKDECLKHPRHFLGELVYRQRDEFDEPCKQSKKGSK